jgi:hypothetical protein
MPRVEFKIDEQASDLRAYEFAYRFTISNNGVTPISVISITPRLPQGVDLLDVKTSTAAAAKVRHTQLCEELTALVQDELIVSSANYRTTLATARAEITEKYIGSLKGFAKGYMAMFTGGAKAIERDFRRLERMGFKIANYSDSALAFERFFLRETADPLFSSLFKSKMEQLQQAEQLEGGSNIDQAIAVIEADSFYAATYVLKYGRRFLEPRKYTVSIDVTYQEANKPEIVAGGTSVTVVISPNPLAMTLIAIISSLLGAALKFAVQMGFSWGGLGYYIFKGNAGISSAILALVFFNIYEFTDWGKRITFGVGWRSALLVGTLCGLFGDRILSALRAFVETK